MNEIALSCECGSIKGKITSFEKTPGNHLVCYCKDCQAFPTHLGKQDVTLDAAGGTRIYQIPPANMHITEGHQHLACLRLKKKGLIRWYANCCNTPIGNTVGLSLPFVGLIHTFIADKVPSPIMGCVHTKSANAAIPEENNPSNSQGAIIAQVMFRLLKWKLTGKGKPNSFFEDSGKAVSKPVVI